MIELRKIEWGTEEHLKMLDLRNRILRIPFNIEQGKGEKKKDKESTLLGVFDKKNDTIIACCLLTPLNNDSMQIRQMAVESSMQEKGLGAKLIAFAENIILENKGVYSYLHARQTAILFYKKQGYKVKGNQFMEVGLPHFEMIKELKE